jgi:xylose dehydrogenase (NAD/NADP)
MADELNWGILGNATIARVCVIPAIQRSRNGVVRAMASRSPEKAAAVARQHGIDRVYGEYDALIDDPAIGAVYIPLPNHLHCPWTLKALAAGKHVLCEKPLAVTASEAEAMAAAARSAGCVLMEAFMYRFHPRSRKIRKLVFDGAIGAPRLIRSAFCFRMSEADFNSSDNVRLSSVKGGGALLDVGCYSVSLARWIYRSEPVKVQCQASYHASGVDLHVTAMLDFGENRLAALEASFISGLQQTYTVVGENGVIELPHDAFIPWDRDAHYFLREGNAETATPTTVPGADEYQLMVEHFADAARGETDPVHSTVDSIRNMRVLDALAAAAHSERAERVLNPEG